MVAADLTISLSQCYILSRSRTMFEPTNSIIRTMMLYCVNTALLTSMCSIACLVAFVVAPDGYTFLALHFLPSKLYLNALLATLNAKETLRGRVVSMSIDSTLSSKNRFSQHHCRHGSGGSSRADDLLKDPNWQCTVCAETSTNLTQRMEMGPEPIPLQRREKSISFFEYPLDTPDIKQSLNSPWTPPS